MELMIDVPSLMQQGKQSHTRDPVDDMNDVMVVEWHPVSKILNYVGYAVIVMKAGVD